MDRRHTVMLPVEVVHCGIVAPLVDAHRYADVRALARVSRAWHEAVDVRHVHRRHRDYMLPFVMRLMHHFMPKPFGRELLLKRLPDAYHDTILWLFKHDNTASFNLRITCHADREGRLLARINRYAYGRRESIRSIVRLMYNETIYDCTFVDITDANRLHKLLYDVLMLSVGGPETRRLCATHCGRKRRRANLM